MPAQIEGMQAVSALQVGMDQTMADSFASPPGHFASKLQNCPWQAGLWR